MTSETQQMSEPHVIKPPSVITIPVVGGGVFPVRRIFCIGRNYVDHVREMGNDPNTAPPIFFTKPREAIAAPNSEISFPIGTNDLHFEGELVVVLKSGGEIIADANAASRHIFGFAIGCDLTRRDLQTAARAGGEPWDAAKGFEDSAPVGEISPVSDNLVAALKSSRLQTRVNEKIRQDALLSDMILTPLEIITALSRIFRLDAGDVVFTGTPEGVGRLAPGDAVAISCGPLAALNFSIGVGDE